MRINKFVWLLAVPVLLWGGAASAEGGLYVGVGIGKVHGKMDRGDFTLGLAGVEETADESNTTYKVFAGYQLTKNVAVEFTYADFGDFTNQYDATVFFGTPSHGTIKYGAKSQALSTVLLLPLSGQWSLLGRMGATRNTVERSTMQGDIVAPGIQIAKKRTTSALIGAGLQYDVSPGLSFRTEFEHFGKFGEPTSRNFATTGTMTGTGETKVYTLTVSLLSRF